MTKNDDSFDQEVNDLAEDLKSLFNSRAGSYGHPSFNLSVSGKIEKIMSEVLKMRKDRDMDDIDDGVYGALMGVMIKLGRILTSPYYVEDTYKDFINYAVIAMMLHKDSERTDVQRDLFGKRIEVEDEDESLNNVGNPDHEEDEFPDE